MMSLRRRMFALAFVDEFGPLYALYTIWFRDNGITAGRISTVFVTWAAITLVLEIPSGALADQLDRRRLLAFAFVLRAAGITIWLVSPTYPGVIAGAVLWATHSSLASGAWEAMIHDQLVAVDAGDRYGVFMARVGQLSHLGIAFGAVVATVALEFGATIAALGWITVAIHAVSIGLVLSLPDVRWVAESDESGAESANATAEEVPPDDGSTYQAWWSTMRSGLADARTAVAVRHLIIIGALMEGLFVFDEYVPILADNLGASDGVIPIIVLMVWVGLLAGGEVAARRPNLSGRSLGLSLAAGALILAATMLTTWYWALALVGVGYAALQATVVIADARLQAQVAHRQRATVSSVRSFGAGLVAVVAFTIIGLLTRGDDPRPGLYAGAGVLVLTGVLATRWLPNAETSLQQPQAEGGLAER